jgi:hypothetical protein
MERLGAGSWCPRIRPTPSHPPPSAAFPSPAFRHFDHTEHANQSVKPIFSAIKTNPPIGICHASSVRGMPYGSAYLIAGKPAVRRLSVFVGKSHVHMHTRTPQPESLA